MNQAEKSKNSLIIIDAYGFIFRAYYVQPPLTAPDGTPVGALYGFTSMLLKLINDFKPSKAVIVLDSGGKNFRHELYHDYKANRPPAPEDLVVQLKLLKEAANALNFPVLEMPGFEADDIIATLAIRATEEQKEAVVVSADKDLMQLINGHIKLYDPVKAKFIGTEDVFSKFGVGPEKVREVQALIGDSSDNIPGVSGIGPKTAAQLINEFGSVENLYDSIDKITAVKQKEKLLANKDKALLSWQLVGLDPDVKVDSNIDQFLWTPPHQEVISDFIHKYGFRSLTKRVETLFNLSSLTASITAAPHSNQATNKAQEARLEEVVSIDHLQKIIDDFIKDGVAAIQLWQGSVYLSNSKFVYQVVLSKPKEIEAGENFDLFSVQNSKPQTAEIFFTMIKKFLEDGSVQKITFDLKYLIKFFGQAICTIEDLMLMDYVLNAGNKSRPFSKLIGDYTGEDLVPFEQNIPSTMAGFIQTYNSIKQELYATKLYHLYAELDLPVCYILSQMEDDGIKIDPVRLKELSNDFGKNIAELEQKIYQITGEEFNIASPKQLGEILFKKMQLPFAKTTSKSGDFATGSDILEKLSLEGYEIADLILQYRHYTKLKNTYTETLPKQTDRYNRIHTTYLQTQTTTSRLSSKDPNVQNIPIRSNEGNKIRSCFVASEGYKLISADYSQIELRILSHVANIEELKKAFREGSDIHSKTASQIFGIPEHAVDAEMRRRAKAINFGIIYGISAHGLAKQLNCSRSEAADYIDRYFAAYPGIKEYMENTIAFARTHGYVENMLGRRCYISDINNKNHALKSYAERAAINAPIQGLNADIVKIAMINCSKMLKEHNSKTKLLLQIHDELVFEVPSTEIESIKQLIRQTMEHAVNLSVPTKVGIAAGDNWQEIH